MDSLSTLLSNKHLEEPQELKELIAYIKTKYDSDILAAINNQGITITVKSAPLASILRLNLPEIRKKLKINQNQVIASKIYNNNQQSYSAFLYALYYAGFNIGNNDPKLLNNTGYCSMGDLYTFELLNNNKVIQKYWTSNCSSVPGTYGGQSYNTINLFRTQVPDYSSMTSNARF